MPPKKDGTTGTKGNNNNRGGKRKLSSPSSSSVDEREPWSTQQKRKRTPSPEQTSNPNAVVIIPPYFLSLIQTHSALNTVFTFLSARKSVITTFDALKPAVERHLKSNRLLLVEDVAAIKALRPEGVRFEYVGLDSLALDARSGGGEKDELFRTAGGGGAALPGIEGLDLPGGGGGGGGGGGQEEEVLFFEFVDEDLKKSNTAGKKTGGGGGGGGRKMKQVKMPVFGLEQMKNLIEKRDKKFRAAVESYIFKCETPDPEVLILQEREAYIPSPSTELPSQFPPAPLPLLPSAIPKERKSIREIVEELKVLPWYTGQIVPDGHRVFEEQEAVYGDLEVLLSQDLVNALYNVRGITQFYAHQAEAINALEKGWNVVVSTSTSSGKSLIYQLPVLGALERDKSSRGMFIFPTKALAQDQVRGLRGLLEFMPGLSDVRVETFDGDTPWQERNEIRDEASVIFTNPDMLHCTILPQEERWRGFLQNLKYVVVDELHYYNGLLGSHMAFIMRRLRRVCAAVGNSHVKFISCSATVANPEDHFKTIFGTELDVRLVDFDGSPSGRKEFLCWNTPYRDPGDPSSGRGNACYECSRLFCQLILRGVRVIAFCRVREECEKLVSGVKQELEKLGRPEVINRVMGYRGGYTAQDRRKIESEMFEGKLLGIIATTALELGVDIGTLDCVLTWGFPYTISNLRQQSGRAGRRNKDSLSILVGDSFATDQHYMDNPDELFTKPNAQLQVDLNNTLVKEGHVQCAAFEMPIRPESDSIYFGSDLAHLCSERLIKDPSTNFYHTHDRFRPQPSKFVSIRDIEDDHFAIIDVTHNRNTVLEELEASRATFTLYDGAIFLHQGETYLVRDFNPDRSLAKVEKVKVNYTTKQRDYTNVDPVETELVKRITDSPCHAYYGPIQITQVVFGYFKVDARNPTRILDAVSVSNPPITRFSKGMWLDIPKSCLDLLTSHKIHVAGSIHAAQHAVMSLIPNFVVSLPGDVRTECKNALKEYSTHETSRKRPARLTFYDTKGGKDGSGINTKAFEFVDDLLKQALERVERCKCVGRVEGCPECCVSEFCKEGNEVMSKAGGRVVLMALLGKEIEEGDVPVGPEERGKEGKVETVVEAGRVWGRKRRGGEGVS
ncbi:putative ATP-dependent helicase HRQ1 [Cladorrhinum sp. PSN332]|nr:putative ATP-dependent helicase HRQ1 [Cladorrhinum sp. PSN332]